MKFSIQLFSKEFLIKSFQVISTQSRDNLCFYTLDCYTGQTKTLRHKDKNFNNFTCQEIIAYFFQHSILEINFPLNIENFIQGCIQNLNNKFNKSDYKLKNIYGLNNLSKEIQQKLTNTFKSVVFQENMREIYFEFEANSKNVYDTDQDDYCLFDEYNDVKQKKSRPIVMFYFLSSDIPEIRTCSFFAKIFYFYPGIGCKWIGSCNSQTIIVWLNFNAFSCEVTSSKFFPEIVDIKNYYQSKRQKYVKGD